jgi:hypothetical protein
MKTYTIQILRSALFFNLLLLGALSVQAQGPAFENVRGSLFGLQGQQLDFTEFNTQANALGYPSLGNDMAELYGGYLHNEGRWYNDYTFAVGWLNSEDGQFDSENSTRYRSVGLQWGSAYNLLNPERPWFFGPGIRVGFRLEQVVLAEQSIVSGLAAAQQAEYLKLTRFSGIHFDLNVSVKRAFYIDKADTNVLVVGLEAGYRTSGGDEEWQVDQAVNLENSGLRNEGFFVGLHFGIGIAQE